MSYNKTFCHVKTKKFKKQSAKKFCKTIVIYVWKTQKQYYWLRKIWPIKMCDNHQYFSL